MTSYGTDGERAPAGGVSGVGRGTAAAQLERGIVAALFLFVICAPHSIAATQGAWLLAMLLWAARLFVRPRPKFFRTPVDYPLLGFLILTVVSIPFSYAPDISRGKLPAVSLLTIIYVTAQNVRTRRELRALVLVLVASSMLSVFYSLGALAVGRGVKLVELRAESPLISGGARVGDTLLVADGRPVREPADVVRVVLDPAAAGQVTLTWPDGKLACRSTHAEACLGAYRAEVTHPVMVGRGALLEGDTPEARLGIVRWSAGRDERASGLYGHYVTFAEVLQLIASLALGLLVARRLKRDWPTALLFAAAAGLTLSLILTLTRASWAGLLVSALTILLVGAGRRTLLVAAAVALPLIVVGLLVLQQKRQVGFLDPNEGSTAWRLTVYREGLELLAREPRHLLVGVGMDSIKRHWREWGLFDKGRLPWGHLHSTPLQIAVERGLPALLAWLAVLFLYVRALLRLVRRGETLDWVERGLALGALGGLAGFFTSGLVHYNLGDSEVVMVFYFIMGLALFLHHAAAGEKPRPGGA